MKHAHVGAALALVLLLGGCEASRERIVKAHLPVSRLELPEPAGTFGGSVAAIGLSRLRLTEDQTQQSPVAAPPDVRVEGSAMAKVQLTPVEYVELSLKGYGVWAGGPQVKLMPLAGAGMPVSVALTYHYAEFHDDYHYDSGSGPEPDAHTSVNQRLKDGALIVGWRASRSWLVFGGAYWSRLHYGGVWRVDSTRTPYGQDTEARGHNFGVAWTPIPFLRVIGEVSTATARTAAQEESLWSPGLAAEFSFSPRRAGRSPPQADDEVRVVPVEPSP